MGDSLTAIARRHRNPRQVQKFLRSLPYNREKNGATLRSAEQALKRKTVHCFEAVFLAAAILEKNGYPPLVLSFESRDGLDHVLFVFQKNNRWGSVGRSRDEGLHGRDPVFRSLRDLAWSYYVPYVDKSGEITAYQLANLDDSKADWRQSRKNVWKAEKYLLDLKHNKLKASRARYKKIRASYDKNGPVLKGEHWW